MPRSEPSLALCKSVKSVYKHLDMINRSRHSKHVLILVLVVMGRSRQSGAGRRDLQAGPELREVVLEVGRLCALLILVSVSDAKALS